MRKSVQVDVVARAKTRGACALFASVALVGGLGMMVLGGYGSDFEALNASSSGVILTGQDGYYIPGGTSSVDYLAFTYTGDETVCSDTSTWVNNSSSSGAGNECGSDDVYYLARREAFAPNASKLLTNRLHYTVGDAGPSSLTASVEASIDNGAVTNVRGRLVVKNQKGGSDVASTLTSLSTADVVVTVVIDTAAGDFVGPNGEVDVDFIFVQTSGGPNWNGRIDDNSVTIPGANALGVPQNPEGGDQFIAGTGPAGGFFARAQRDITWPTPVSTVTYDVSASFEGTLPTAQNVGSFSTQDNASTAGFIHLFTWVDTNTATNWNSGFLMFNAAGTQDPQPGQFPGPQWQNLDVDHWYRFGMTIDFSQNRVLEVSITDLETNTTTTVDVSGLDYYLRGGAAGGFPLPTGFRFFAGGGTAGNTLAWDNPAIN